MDVPDLYRQQHEALLCLLCIAREERTCVEAADWRGVAALSDAKAAILWVISHTTERISAGYSAWWKANTPPRRQSLNAILDSILATLEELQAEEEAIEQALLQAKANASAVIVNTPGARSPRGPSFPAPPMQEA